MTWRDIFDWENYSAPLVLRVLQSLLAFIAFLAATALTSAGAGVLAMLLTLAVALYGAIYFVVVEKLNKVKLTGKTKLIAEAGVLGLLLLALIFVASSSLVFFLSKSAANACCVFVGFGLVAQLALLKITYTDHYLYEKSMEPTIGTPANEV